MKNIKEYGEFINEEFMNIKNPFKKNKELSVRFLDTTVHNYKTEPEETSFDFSSLMKWGRNWEITLTDHTMEYGSIVITYNQIDNEIEDIKRFGYERQHHDTLEITDDTLNDIKKIIRKNK